MSDDQWEATTRGAGLAGRLVRLATKELREILRDRRTIVTLVLMPILLYPILSLAFQRFLLTSLRPAGAAQPVYRIAAESERTLLRLLQLIRLAEETDPLRPPPQLDPLIPNEGDADLERELRTGGVDVVVRLKPDTPPTQPDADVALDWELKYLDTSVTGRKAFEYLDERLRVAGTALLAERLKELELSQRAQPILVTEVALTDGGKGRSSLLAQLIPVILILMTITGAVYPAIDLTAGERERGTLETLAAAPVPRLGLLFAKYVAVVTVAFLTAAVNLVSMAITIYAGGLGSVLFGQAETPWLTLLQVFALLLLFACFFSGILLTLTCFARSFKEAQAYLIPVMLFALSPALASLVPDLQLTGWLAVTPLLNIALLARDLLSGTAHWGTGLVVVVSTGLWAMSSISIAATVFGAESVLYDTGAGWTDLFRRASTPQPAAAPSTALFCLAGMFPALFLWNGVVQQLAGPLAVRLLVAALGTGLIFVAFPLWAGRQGRVQWTTGFHWRRPPAAAWLVAVLWGVSLWPLAHEAVVWAQRFGLASLSAEQMERVQALATQLRDVPFWITLAAVALVPAVCEEFFFRGYLQGALAHRLSPAAAIASSAVLFGLFHLVGTDALALERLLPSCLLGLFLGLLCWRTGSVFPGMLLHACHNGLLIAAYRYQRELQQLGWGPGGATDLEHADLPWTWIAASLATVAAGGAVLRLMRGRTG